MNDLWVLKTCCLFAGFTEEKIGEFLKEAGTSVRSYRCLEEIYPFNDVIRESGIILSGEVDITQYNYTGSEGIVSRYRAPSLIGQAFCMTRSVNNVSHFVARTSVRLLLLDLRHILSDAHLCARYPQFSRNIILSLSESNIILNQKIEVLTQKSLRDKLMMYFSQMKEAHGGTTICLPFNREQLAQYVCSERSSVCRELSHMQSEGLIRLDGNFVTVYS